MVTDVISKLANRGVFFLVTSRNSKFMTEDQLPASAIGKILLVHAILKVMVIVLPLVVKSVQQCVTWDYPQRLRIMHEYS